MAKSFKASNLKIVLIVLLLLTFCGIVAGYIFFSANQTNSTGNTTDISIHTNSEVSNLKQYIEKNQINLTIIDKLIPSTDAAQSLVTTSVDKAASANNVIIANKSFTKLNNNMNLQTVNNLTPDYVTLTFTNPIKYDNFIKFMESIENSTPKLQIMNVNITPNTNPAQVTVTPMTIGFYKR